MHCPTNVKLPKPNFMTSYTWPVFYAFPSMCTVGAPLGVIFVLNEAQFSTVKGVDKKCYLRWRPVKICPVFRAKFPILYHQIFLL